MDIHDQIRARIESVLEKKELSVAGVSKAAGLGETTLRNFLKGMTRSLTIESVDKLAPAMGVSSHWIIFGEGAEVVSIHDRIPFEERPAALKAFRAFERKA